MTDESSPRGLRRGTRTIALIAVAALVISLFGVTIALVAGGDGDGDDGDATPTVSPTLALSRTSNVASQGAGGAGGAGYALRGKLTGTGDTGVVITPATSTTTRKQVDALLAALDFPGGDPVRVAGGWTARGTVAGQKAAFALDESAGNVWQYARGPLADCLSVRPGGAPQDSASCAAATTAPKNADAKGPGRKALVADAADLFKLIGVAPGTGLRANDAAGVTYLDVPLTVEDLPVVDVALSVGADDRGIASGSGWLDPSFTTVGRYPLIDADAAFADLLEQPFPEIAPTCAAGQTCPPPTPQAVTNARLAWLTSQDQGRTVLVPAWQFEAGGFYGPAVVAVDPQYLAEPS